MLSAEERAGFVELAKGPGKFECCRPWAVPLYVLANAGCSDDRIYDSDGTKIDIFVLGPADDGLRLDWPDDFGEHAEGTELWVWEDSQGFVNCDVFGPQEAVAKRREIEAECEARE